MQTGNKMVDSAIEAGNFTLALKLVEKKIQQSPGASQHVASKCYILANIALNGSNQVTADEALKQCIELSTKTPADPTAIKLLSGAFELLNYTPKEDLYEAAMKKYQSSALAFDWFQRTVAKNDLTGMQKSAMALSKSFKVETDNGRMIKLWAAITMVMVTNLCNDQERLSNGKDKLLSMLGLKIIESVEGVTKTGLNAQEMFIKCHLLLKKGDNKQCIEELQKFLLKESDLELLLLYFEQLKTNELWNELYDATTKYLVETGVDDWDTWKLAITAAKKIEKVDDIKNIIDNYKVGRNTQLAKIFVLESNDIDGKKLAVMNYLNLYIHKLCCYLDLKVFLDEEILPKDVMLSTLQTVVEGKLDFATLEDKTVVQENVLNTLINYMKIKANVSPELFEEESFFDECCKYYNATKHLEKKLPEFDYYAGFEFVILAIQTYMTLNKDNLGTQKFLNMIVLLENCLIKNKHEFHLQLWLSHFYSNTNMNGPLKRIFDALKIKNVQIDTVSPHFSNHATTRTRNNDLLTTSTKFYSHNVAAELPTMIMNCFETQTFSKVQGFIEFKIRVENSITHFQLALQNIQWLRLNGQKHAPATIASEYVPILKNAYRLICLAGKDVDVKLHDNIDRKIMWDCGDHKTHDLLESIVLNPYSGIVDTAYVMINVLKELIINDPYNLKWDDYRTRFLNLISDRQNLLHFTEIEKDLLNVFSYLLHDDESTKLNFTPTQPSNTMDPSFNDYHLSIQDFDCVLSTIMKNSSTKTFFGQKKNNLKIKNTQNIIRALIRNIDRDEIIVSAKSQLKEYKQAAHEWFSQDKFGKQFNVPEDVINMCYKNFDIDLLKSVREI